jgi:hypothetical protein
MPEGCGRFFGIEGNRGISLGARHDAAGSQKEKRRGLSKAAPPHAYPPRRA